MNDHVFLSPIDELKSYTQTENYQMNFAPAATIIEAKTALGGKIKRELALLVDYVSKIFESVFFYRVVFELFVAYYTIKLKFAISRQSFNDPITHYIINENGFDFVQAPISAFQINEHFHIYGPETLALTRILRLKKADLKGADYIQTVTDYLEINDDLSAALGLSFTFISTWLMVHEFTNNLFR
jgi:hypothetical protein